MGDRSFSSPAIARKMQIVYGSKAKVLKINIMHREDVKRYVNKIEEAHKQAANCEIAFK